MSESMPSISTGVAPVPQRGMGSGMGAPPMCMDGSAPSNPSTAHGQGAHATSTPNPIIKRQGAYLPHWTKDGASYAVNFRLGDSLPKHVLEDWRREREALERALEMRGELSEVEQKRLRDLHADKVERYLDTGHGACWMKQPRIAELIAGILTHFDGERYHLLAWCVMPNHVHAVFTPLPGHDLPDIVGGWKSLSAKRANAMLGRTGTFWQTESYDHLVRDAGDLAHAIKYALENPEEAGLKNWPWRGRGMGAPPMDMDGVAFAPSNPSTAHGRGAHATPAQEEQP